MPLIGLALINILNLQKIKKIAQDCTQTKIR